MNDLNQWIQEKIKDSRRQTGVPWWVWALVAAGGLSVLMGWLLRRRSMLQEPEPESGSRDVLPFPRVRVAVNTSVENIAPVVQDIPLPGQSSSPETPVSLEKVVSPDDLTVIEGIGPKISSVLREAGIITHAQLATASPARLQEILRQAKIRLGDPTTWPEQASLAAAGDWKGLQALQNQLKGGRRVSEQ